MHPPQTLTFDSINQCASFSQSKPHSTLLVATSISQPSDLAHVASIVQGLVAIVQPATNVAPSTLENKPAPTTSAPLSAPRNTPTKLSCFLRFAEQHLGVDSATGYEDKFWAHGYGPDILHLVEDAALQCIGLSEGDIIQLKQNALCWWNLESESNKCKCSDDDDGEGGPTLPHSAPHTPRTPPNVKVQYEKRYHDGGSARLYGPQLTPGTLPLDMDFDWTYFCQAHGEYVPLPDGYIPVLDASIIL